MAKTAIDRFIALIGKKITLSSGKYTVLQAKSESKVKTYNTVAGKQTVTVSEDFVLLQKGKKLTALTSDEIASRFVVHKGKLSYIRYTKLADDNFTRSVYFSCE